MQTIFETVTDGIYWFFDTGWDIWSSLFAPLPYGDPYIAIAAAMIVFLHGQQNHRPRQPDLLIAGRSSIRPSDVCKSIAAPSLAAMERRCNFPEPGEYRGRLLGINS